MALLICIAPQHVVLLTLYGATTCNDFENLYSAEKMALFDLYIVTKVYALTFIYHQDYVSVVFYSATICGTFEFIYRHNVWCF